MMHENLSWPRAIRPGLNLFWWRVEKKFWRHTDVANVNLAEKGLGGWPEKADFHRGEGAGVVSPNGVLGWLAGVAIEAAGEINGEDFGRCSAAVDPVDCGIEWWARFAGGSGAEEGVDAPGGVTGVMI